MLDSHAGGPGSIPDDGDEGGACKCGKGKECSEVLCLMLYVCSECSESEEAVQLCEG